MNEFILKLYAYVKSDRNFGDGYTPLHCAVENGNEKIVKLIVSDKADVDALGKNGIAPLHIAAKHGYSDIAKFLIEQGAVVNSFCSYSNKGGYTPLHIAARKGFNEITEVLLRGGSAINAVTDDGLTALHIAVTNKQELLVKILLSHNADVNAKTKDGMTSLLLASRFGYSSVVEILLKQKPDLDDNINKSALYTAVNNSGNEYIKIVNDLLKYGFGVNSNDINNCKLLFSSVINKHNKIVKKLLSFGADVNLINKEGDTLLHCVIKERNKNIIKLLLEHRCNVNATDKKGRTPIFYAIENNNYLVTKLLLKNNANIKCEDNLGVTPLHVNVSVVDMSTKGPRNYFKRVCRKNIPRNINEIANLLIKQGAEVDAKSKDGLTPLHVAVGNKFNNLIELLLAHNANINLREGDNKTPLYLAIEKNNTMAAKLLIEKGAKVNKRDKTGKTALHVAVESKCDVNIFPNFEPESMEPNNIFFDKVTLCTNEGIIRKLLNNNANVNAKDEHGETALHIASKGDCKIAVEVLLEYNADVNAVDNKNRTPIYNVAKYGKKEICRMLLNRGAIIDIKDMDGKTALRVAVERRSVAYNIIELLLEFNSDVNSRCNLGKTPFHVAVRKGYINVVNLLLKFGGDVNVTCNDGKNALDYVSDVWAFRVDHIIKEHIVKLMVAGLYVSQKNLDLLGNNFLMQNQIEYTMEISHMQGNKIGTSDVYYFDLFAIDEKKLVIFSRNKSIGQVLRSNEYITNYPLYACLLASPIRMIRMRIERKKSQIGAYDFFYSFTNHFTKLPYECTAHIFSYLSDFDIKTLETAESTKL